MDEDDNSHSFSDSSDNQYQIDEHLHQILLSDDANELEIFIEKEIDQDNYDYKYAFTRLNLLQLCAYWDAYHCLSYMITKLP